MGYVENLNMNEVEAWDGEGGDTVDVGDYVFRVNDATQDKSAAGHPTLILDMEVVSAEDGSDTDQAGKTVRKWLSLQAKKGCRRRLKSMLLACDVTISDEGGFDTEEFSGKEFVATVVHKPYTKENPAGEEVTFTNADIVRERAA